MRVAAVLIDGTEIAVHPSQAGPLVDEMGALGATAVAGAYVLPVERLEEALSALDRQGFVWSLGERFVARTWAERLFAEVPPEYHEAAFAALGDALDGLEDHRAVLLDAWQTRDGRPLEERDALSGRSSGPPLTERRTP